ncbi:DUF1488 family protein [Candidatus Thiodiazotropha sp. CDECU1]|uniref:DUF1488 family protein n=1 Tax=Candidatus Thiodiazotropha sp. CDECU1 TaxID=3065865 RepID=UPI00292DC085|nr:DUF1488 family protein [Candidatus Thiodiazotropha sp. CDECU1]
MTWTNRRISVSDDTVIHFPGYESWNSMTEMATVAADVNKERVLCRVSLNILEDKFGVMDDTPVRCIAHHRAVIQEAARKLIQSESFEDDGSILIRSGDI